MRLSCFLIVVVTIIFSCRSANRNFLSNLKEENHFLDTFSQYNLRKFGISNHPENKEGKSYYDFNNSKNSIYIGGGFRKEANQLFFCPRNSDKELLFFSDSVWSNYRQMTPQKLTTKGKDVYEVTWLGSVYNGDLKDSTFNIELKGDGFLNHPESLIFEISKSLEVFHITYINCRNDTLIMKFGSNEKVYFSHVNESASCL